MKFRLSIVINLLAAVILTGCSADDEPLYESQVVENSAVEISLGLASTPVGSEESMRAMVVNDNPNLFSLNENHGGLGIFCLATSRLSAKASIPNIDWTVSDNNVCMDNVSAIAKVRNFGQGNVTSIEWENHYYYPMGGWYKYSFYGYSPHVTSPEIASDKVTVDYVLDGTQDVIWGSTGDTEYYATYFTAHLGETPSLRMQHLLTGLRFRAIAGDDKEGVTVDSRGIRVTCIEIANVPVHQTLTLADRTNPENIGTLVAKENATKEAVYLRDDIAGSGYLNGSYLIKSTAASALEIGNGVMLPPSDHYYIKVTMRDKLGNDCSPQGYFRIAPTSGTFEPGKYYWIQMRISAKPENTDGGIDIISD